MNSKIILLGISLFLFLCCKKHKNDDIVVSKFENNLQNDSLKFNKVKDSSIIIEKINIKKEINQIIPDTTINNKLALANYESLISFYQDYKKINTIDRIRESPVVIFSNKLNTEYLIAYQYEGSTNNSFDCFEIGYLINDKELIKTKLLNTIDENFKTENNLGLGTSLKELIIIKGSNFETKKNNNESIITFRNTNRMLDVNNHKQYSNP